MLPLLTTLATDLDDITIDFDSGSLTFLKIVIALILFGVALDTKLEDFTAAIRRPVPIAIGVVAQFVLLPALTFLLTIALDVRGSVALGMILVACCPPGNVSNILTHRSGGDVALSVSMTAVSNVLSIFLLPINLAFWGGLSPHGDDLLQSVDMSIWETFGEIALVIGLPFAAGIAITRLWPRVGERAHQIVGPVSFVLLAVIIVLGFTTNFDIFQDYITVVLLAVFLQNALALALGYVIARATRLPVRQQKAMTFEVGVRNTGLGLLLVFTYFDGLGGMALVAAWWGLYDIITGLVVATVWRRRTTLAPEPAVTA
ncbi:bile acid:sodium symporter family protein [Nocardioides sp. URHA0020]|uniref:bile acid:sodium symporter family protein n=1 Tax=Nocardioides sp. URHA0020 TaxID=1380392 RepID=UPI00048B819D|nr:bile acid:sodium symporter family protein [Nocardioides sp. URHA0020]